MKTYLLTGGTGYIGSHCCIELFNHLQNQSDFQIILLDNLYNSSLNVLKQIRSILQISEDDLRIKFVQIDLMSELIKLDQLFSDQKNQNSPICSVIHFAAYKAVGESVQKPLLYYQNNLISTMNLLQTMIKHDCKNIIFSSSATVYGTNECSQENSQLTPMNPYGSTKVCIEYMLKDMSIAYKDFSFISLRYYNPCGAHDSGQIGDQPTIYPNNLFPVIEQVVAGKRQFLSIFGNDYNTPDGTGVRDYIHVMDLADAHIKAFKQFGKPGYHTYNIGTGNGFSVLEVVQTYAKAINKEIPYKIVERRQGDVPKLTALPDKAKRELGWQSTRSLLQMCQDSFRFTQKVHTDF